ncbi:MAG: MFS transporter [candidate division Zixibacteria bacterium]|jgi:predicted MFS family arabinose efflux permease|nr:MFS transporter [candidate division Zixibacteria bacterium]
MNLRLREVSIGTVTLSAVTVWIGFYSWQILFNNFAVDLFSASAADVGIIQAVREIPGLLAFGAGALALYFTESRVGAVSIVTLGAGLILCGLSSSLLMLGAATVLMSFGFHYFEPNNSSQLLMLAKQGEVGRVQGRLLSFESVAGLAGAGLVLWLTLFLDYRVTFYLLGGAVTLVGLYLTWALPANRSDSDVRTVTIKREYKLYYTLSFLQGCRRHIFSTFALFLLVKNHGLNITAISSIMLANNVITMFTNRAIGHLSDRIGERRVLASASAVLIVIFAGYAFVDYLAILIAFFLVDNVLVGSSIALKSYLRRIAPPEDLTGCLSFGMTANHITAVVIPVVGGVAWTTMGHEVTFIAGAIVVAMDLLFSLRIPDTHQGSTRSAASSA